MRDRSRPMVWVEKLAGNCTDVDEIKAQLSARVKKASTVSDQLRALRKHGLLPQIHDDQIKSVEQTDNSDDKSADAKTGKSIDHKTFKPQPKVAARSRKKVTAVKRKR